MRFAIIENKKVVNIVIADEALDTNWISSTTAKIGDSYTDGVFEAFDPIQDDDVLIKQAIEVREKRNVLLSSSDWTQLADSPVDKDAWALYRQALRDIPTQESFPLSVIWPEKP